MRKIGFLLMLFGVALAGLYPLYQEQFTGQEIARHRIFDRNDGGWQNGWREASVTLEESQSPLRIRFTGHVLPGNYLADNSLPLDVELRGSDGVVFASRLEISVRENPNESASNERSVQIATTEFGVIANGIHTLKVTSPLERDVNLNWMDAIFVANVAVRDTQFRDIGIGMFAAGLLMVIAGRKRRKKDKRKPVRLSRWGRQRK